MREGLKLSLLRKEKRPQVKVEVIKRDTRETALSFGNKQQDTKSNPKWMTNPRSDLRSACDSTNILL